MFQRTSLVGMACCALAACSNVGATPPDLTTAALTDQKPQGLPRADGWQPNERLTAEIKRGPDLVSIPAERSGTTPSGIAYAYFGDGSGSVRPDPENLLDTWSIDCTRDAMTDQRNCTVTGRGLVVVYRGSAKPSAVCIQSHNYPRRMGAIRIDGGRPIPTSEEGCVPGDVAAQLARASIVAVRSVHWPYDNPRDATPSTRGLGDALALAAFIYTHIDRLAFP